MKFLLTIALSLLTPVIVYGQHTWDFEVFGPFSPLGLTRDSVSSVKLIDNQLVCYQLQSIQYQWPNTLSNVEGIYIWGKLAFSQNHITGNSNTNISCGGFIEIPNFNPLTDKLVVNYFGWNGSSYDNNMSKVLQSFGDVFGSASNKGLFMVDGFSTLMEIRSIDWYRNDKLITDPVTLGINSPNAKLNIIEQVYNLSGMQVNSQTKGIIIKDGKKILNR